MIDIRQSTFAGGEISPILTGRVDLARYLNSLALSRNGIVTRHGAWVNRSGTKFVGEVKDSGKRVRLIPFSFGNDQNFVLEFGDRYIRFFKDGGRVLVGQRSGWNNFTTYAQSAYVAANPGSGYRMYRSLQPGNLNHSPPANPAWWEDLGPELAVEQEPYEVITAFTEEQLPRLKFAQSGDVVTLVHPSHEPQELRRLANTNWTIIEIDFDVPWPGIRYDYDQWPVGGQFAPEGTYIEYDLDLGVTGTTKLYHWAVTRVVKETATGRIFETRAVTTPAGQFATRDMTYLAWDPGFNYVGSGAVIRGSDGFLYVNTQPAGNQGHDPTLRPYSTAWWAMVPVGAAVIGPYNDRVGYQFVLGEHKPKLVWTFSALPAGYTDVGWRLYQGQGEVLGLIYVSSDVASLTHELVIDGSLTPDFNINPPDGSNPIKDLKPETVTVFDQRRIFGKINRVIGSKVGDYYRFDRPFYLQDDSAIDFLLATQQYEEIRWFVTLRALLAGTNVNAPWLLSGAGGARDVLTPNSISARPQSRYGSSWLDPVVVGNAALMVQEMGNLVREVIFDFATDSYQSNDMSVMAEHLFEDHTIVSWAYAQSPFSVLWGARSDGILLGFTYSREQEVAAWHWHDTYTLAGRSDFEEVCSVQEGLEHAVYTVIRRSIDGQYKRYIERFTSRILPRTATGEIDVARGVFLDSSLTYDGPPATNFAGLDHLVGEAVMVLADGHVLGPYIVPPDGSINIAADMEEGASVAAIGLGYVSQVGLLDAVNSGVNLKSRIIRVVKMGFEVVESLGLKVGKDFDHLVEWRQRTVEAGYGPVKPETGTKSILIPSAYTSGGRAVLQQDQPLPVTVVSVTREVDLGDD